jgi:hypothetical protein
LHVILYCFGLYRYKRRLQPKSVTCHTYQVSQLQLDARNPLLCILISFTLF